jgi:hypothetical protein
MVGDFGGLSPTPNPQKHTTRIRKLCRNFALVQENDAEGMAFLSFFGFLTFWQITFALSFACDKLVLYKSKNF